MQLTGALTDLLVALPAAAGFRSPDFRLSSHAAFSDSKNLLSASGVFLKSYSQSCIPRLNSGLCKCRARGLIVKASGDSNDNLVPIAPLQCESPVGQLLTQILQTHPHLLPATIDQQLENLQTERDAQQKEQSSVSFRDTLYKRIAEVKEEERRKALEEIIYCFIVHKFVENNIVMIPKISATSAPVGRVDSWPNQEQKLEAVHSREAFEMILSHLSLLLGERRVGPLITTVEMSKIKLGKLYAASIMYGYFLKRVDERYQLEKTMRTLPKDFSGAKSNHQESSPANEMWDPDSLIEIPFTGPDGDEGGFVGTNEDKSNGLRSYVMHLDADTLQRYATIRSKEAMSLIEKQTQAIFGKPDVRISDGKLDTSNDEVITLTFSGLTMLVLEATAFGSFLWIAESYTEHKYHFVKN